MATEECLVADNDIFLRLIKIAFKERGVPYHFCKADYERNKVGLPMNDSCDMLCVGPHRDISSKHHAIVTCGSNQRLRGTAIWGTRGNSHRVPVPSKEGCELLLNQAFNHVQLSGLHDNISMKRFQLPVLGLPKHSGCLRPRFAVGEIVKCKHMGQWISGKVIAHYPEEWVRKNCNAMPVVPYLVREDKFSRRLMYVLDDNDDVIVKRHTSSVVQPPNQPPIPPSRRLLPQIFNDAIHTIDPHTKEAVFGAEKKKELPMLLHGVYVWTDRRDVENSILTRKYGKF